MFNLSIKTKIIVFYIILTFVSLFTLTLIFRSFLVSSLESNSKENLVNDIGSIVKYVNNSMILNRDDLYNDVIVRLQQEKYNLGFNSYQSSIVIFFDENYVVVNAVLLLKEDESKLVAQILPALIETSRETSANIIKKFNMNGIDYMGIIEKAKDFYILLYMPIGPLQTLIDRSTLGMFITMVLTMFLAFGTGIILSRSIVKPIRIINEATNEIAKRNFDARVNIKWKKELGELASSINKLASDLNEYDMAQKIFLQNASHELKTPLMSIHGYAEGLKDGVFDNPDIALDVIIDESMRLNRIVEELIYLTKLETMEDFFVYDIESINKVIKSCITKVGSIALKKKVKIIFEPVNDIYVCIDKDKINQAIINILSNCIRYSRKKINIDTSISPNKISITITDDGEGFSDNDLKNLYTRFYKGKNGVTGLGLAITKAILKRHNGTIEISNNLDGGAKFVLQIPIKHV